jgi:hypothetical protein
MKKLIVLGVLFVMYSNTAVAGYPQVVDHYKTIVESTPYYVSECRPVSIAHRGPTKFNSGGAVVGGL